MSKERDFGSNADSSTGIARLAGAILIVLGVIVAFVVATTVINKSSEPETPEAVRADQEADISAIFLAVSNYERLNQAGPANWATLAESGDIKLRYYKPSNINAIDSHQVLNKPLTSDDSIQASIGLPQQSGQFVDMQAESVLAGTPVVADSQAELSTNGATKDPSQLVIYIQAQCGVTPGTVEPGSLREMVVVYSFETQKQPVCKRLLG